MARHIPVARPLPDIADHVVEPVSIGWETADWGDARIAVLFGVVDRKDALPGVGDGPAILVEGLAPILALTFAAAWGVFPLRLGRKRAPEPMRVGEGILVSDMDDGMVLLTLDR